MKLDNPIYTHHGKHTLIDYRKYPNRYVHDHRNGHDMYIFFQAPEAEIEKSKYKRKNWYAVQLIRKDGELKKENILITHKAKTKRELYDSLEIKFEPQSNKDIQKNYRRSKSNKGQQITITLEYYQYNAIKDRKESGEYSSIEEGVNTILKKHFEGIDYG